MIHTFLERGPREFHIGLWPADPKEAFISLFTVDSLIDALTAVNYLNGGAEPLQGVFLAIMRNRKESHS